MARLGLAYRLRRAFRARRLALASGLRLESSHDLCSIPEQTVPEGDSCGQPNDTFAANGWQRAHLPHRYPMFLEVAAKSLKPVSPSYRGETFFIGYVGEWCCDLATSELFTVSSRRNCLA